MQVPTCLLEAATLHKSVKPVCRCGHSATFNPHGLWWHFERRHWNDSLTAVAERFWCMRCASASRSKVRPIRIELVNGSEGDVQLPFPPRATWKRTMSRVR